MHRYTDHGAIAPNFRIDATHAASEAATQAAVQLRRIAGADASGIRVHSDGETVRVTGHVPRWHLKQLATATVRQFSAEAAIENELTVGV